MVTRFRCDRPTNGTLVLVYGHPWCVGCWQELQKADDYDTNLGDPNYNPQI